MANTVLPLSSDIYLEVDGKKVSVVQSYATRATRTSREIEAFGENEPVATIAGANKYTLSDRKVEGGRGDAARDDRGAVHRRAGGYRGGERDEDRHCGQFPRDRVREALWRERRGVRSDDAEGVRDDVAIEKAKPA